MKKKREKMFKKPHERFLKSLFDAMLVRIATEDLMKAKEWKSYRINLLSPCPRENAREWSPEDPEWDYTNMLRRFGSLFAEAKFYHLKELFTQLSRAMLNFRALEEEEKASNEEIAQKHCLFLEHAFLWKKVIFLISGIIILGGADIGFLSITLADSLMGIDVEHFKDLFDSTFIGALTFLTSIGIFWLLMLASQFILEKQSAIIRSIGWLSIFLLGSGFGYLRAGEFEIIEQSDYLLRCFIFVIFFFASIGLPMICAYLKINLNVNLKTLKEVRKKISAIQAHTSMIDREKRKIEAQLMKLREDFYREIDWFKHFHEDELEKYEQTLEENFIFERKKEADLKQFELAFKLVDKLINVFQKNHFKRLWKILLMAFVSSLNILSILFFYGCKNPLEESELNVSILCDRSSSAGEYSCSDDILNSLGARWAKEIRKSGFGTFEIFIIGNSFNDVQLFFQEKYPEKFRPPVNKNKLEWEKDFLSRLERKITELPHNQGSAIAEAIFRVIHRMSNQGGILTILSDMREVNGKFNFERKVPSFESFSQYLEKEELNIDLSKIDVHICGVHLQSPENTSPITAKDFRELEGLWKKIFERWGKSIELYEVCDPEIIFKERRN